MKKVLATDKNFEAIQLDNDKNFFRVIPKNKKIQKILGKKRFGIGIFGAFKTTKYYRGDAIIFWNAQIY